MNTVNPQYYLENFSKTFFHWLSSVLIGSAITLLVFLILPKLNYRDPDNPEPVIQLDFIPWQKVQPVKIKPKSVKKPIQRPKPRPVKKTLAKSKPKPKLKPEIKPAVKPKPLPEPVPVKKTAPEPPPVPQKKLKPAEEQTPPQPAVKTEPQNRSETAAADNALPVPVPIFQLSNMPRFLHKVLPVYPKILKHRGITSGRVTLSVLIDATGKIRNIQVLNSSHPEFAQAAIDAINACSFQPADIKGKPVATRLKIPFKFRLQ